MRGPITHRVNTTGGGSLTLADLETMAKRARAHSAPDDARIEIHIESGQRESGWNFTVSWTDSGPK